MQTMQTKDLIQAAQDNIIGKLEKMLIRSPDDDTEIELVDDPLQRLGKKIHGLVEESKSMHMRLLNLERRMASGKGDGEGRSRSLTKAALNQSEADDFAHEAHLKLVTILSEINDVKESFKLLKNTVPDEYLKAEGIPNFSNYVPYMTRLMELETHYSLLPQRDTVDRLVKDIDSLKLMIVTELGSAARGALPAGLVDVMNELGTLKKQVSERSEGRKVTVSIQPMRDPLDIVPETPVSDPDQIRDIPLMMPIDPNTEMLKQAVLTIQKTVSQKMNRSEIDSIISTVRRTTSLSIENAKMSETFNGFEERMGGYNKELERLHKEFAEHMRVVSEVDDHVNRQDRIQQESLQRVKAEFSQRLEDFYEKLNTVADDPESAKSINALKVVIMKMQKDIKEIRTEVVNRPAAIATGQRMVSSGEASPTGHREEGVNDLVLKHESLLKQLSIQIAKIYADFEETQTQIQKQNESLLGGSLKQMEELRKYVSTMMEKVNEGAKLSQSDLEKLNEVMTILEEKGDKTEIRTKVDKIELKKTHRILSRRIEALQKELKRSESLLQMPPPREDPLMIKTRFDHECLACGQEVPFPTWQREWKASKRFPETRFRLGPGFSKILPVLKELSDVYVSHHQKTQSEGRATPGERGFTPFTSNTPIAAQSDRGSLHRITTGNPSSRSSVVRRKDPSVL